MTCINLWCNIVNWRYFASPVPPMGDVAIKYIVILKDITLPPMTDVISKLPDERNTLQSSKQTCSMKGEEKTRMGKKGKGTRLPRVRSSKWFHPSGQKWPKMSEIEARMGKKVWKILNRERGGAILIRSRSSYPTRFTYFSLFSLVEGGKIRMNQRMVPGWLRMKLALHLRDLDDASADGNWTSQGWPRMILEYS